MIQKIEGVAEAALLAGGLGAWNAWMGKGDEEALALGDGIREMQERGK